MLKLGDRPKAISQASGKLWGHYKELQSTIEYWQALSLDMGIPISKLVLEIRGLGKGAAAADQATWGHPLVASDLAQWVSVHFRVWANKVTVPVGYVNLTQMCKASGKFWADYKRQDSTTEYLQALSNDMGIPISSLILELEGFGSVQATWGHPLGGKILN